MILSMVKRLLIVKNRLIPTAPIPPVVFPVRNPFKNLFHHKRCSSCKKVLRNPQRNFCSKECVCAHMTQLASSPDYCAERARKRQARLVTIYCKTCGKDLGLKVPDSVTYCSRTCAGNDPDIRASKSAKRQQLWKDPVYRQQRSEEAKARNADPTNGFGKNH